MGDKWCLLTELYMFPLLYFAIWAAPVPELSDKADNGLKNSDGIVKRLGESTLNPIFAVFDIEGWEDIAEENCFAMLCLNNAQRTYQRVPTRSSRKANYRASGASLHPFQPQQLATRHTSQINPSTDSAEEFPWRSIQQGGANYHVFPASQREQNGSAILNGYRLSYVNLGDWFTIAFTGAPFGLHCTALFSNPPGRSPCKNRPQQTLFDTKNVHLDNYSYKGDKSAGRPYSFLHAAGPYKGHKRSEDLEDLESFASET